jgi:DUF177 domain-containing protein
MLKVDIRDLGRGPVETDAELEPADPILDGLGLELAGPVTVEGSLQATSEGEYLWRGRIRASVTAECRRCLTNVRQEIDAGVDVLFSSDPDAADDPSIYPLAETATHVDVGEAVREELALAAQPYVLCREDCAGLCPKCGADLNAGPCECAASAEPVRGSHGGS